MRAFQPLSRPELPLQSLSRAIRQRLPAPRRSPFSTTTRPPCPRNRNGSGKPPKRRPYSTAPNPNNPNPNNSAASKADRILSRLPRPLQRYAARLRGAPVTHVVAFLVLHEITAVVPLLGLFGLFHYTEYVPVAWMVAHYGGYVRDGVGRFERWFRRRGLFGFGPGGEGGEEEEEEEQGLAVQWEGPERMQAEEGAEGVLERWEQDPKYRVVVEIGLAYALTKVLLPVRIVGSVWATPWFAGVLGRLRRVVGRAG